MSDAAGDLTRWDRSGGHWRVVSRRDDVVVVSLMTCDGGTEMGRILGSATELDPVLAGRGASDGDVGSVARRNHQD